MPVSASQGTDEFCCGGAGIKKCNIDKAIQKLPPSILHVHTSRYSNRRACGGWRCFCYGHDLCPDRGTCDGRMRTADRSQTLHRRWAGRSALRSACLPDDASPAHHHGETVFAYGIPAGKNNFWKKCNFLQIRTSYYKIKALNVMAELFSFFFVLFWACFKSPVDTFHVTGHEMTSIF